MTDRDRLIELLVNFRKPDNLITQMAERMIIEKIADYLLANGVIVPPCKVGDVVYQIMDIESVHRQILELKVLRIEIEEPTIRFWCQTVKKYRYNFGELDIEDFGKTVFLTKEEAEQILKEREG